VKRGMRRDVCIDGEYKYASSVLKVNSRESYLVIEAVERRKPMHRVAQIQCAIGFHVPAESAECMLRGGSSGSFRKPSKRECIA
jgi:hypothetical protein